MTKSNDESKFGSELKLDGQRTETIDLSSFLTTDVSTTGSFDIRENIWATTFGKLIQALPIPTFLIDADYKIIQANQACVKISDDFKSFPGTPFCDFFQSASSGEKMRSALEEIFATRQTRIFESVLSTGRRKVWARITLRSLRLKEDRIVLALIEDLTNEKIQIQTNERLRQDLERRVKERTLMLSNANESLAKAEKRYRSLFEEAPLMYVITRNERGVPYVKDCNRYFLQTTGYSREEVLGEPLSKFYSQDSIDRALKNGDYERTLAGEFLIGERQLLTRKGNHIPTLLYTVREQDENGRVVGTRSIFADITEKKKAEEDAQRWSSVIEHAQWGIVYSSSDLSYLEFMNPAFAEMHGYTVEELKGKPIMDMFAPDERASLPEHIAIAHQKGHHIWESKHIRKDGSVFPVLINATAVKNKQGQVLYRAVSVEDITERKRIEELALKSAHLRSIADISSGVAHHFNNLLQIVMGGASLALDDLESGNLVDAKRFLNKILSTSKLGAEMVKRLQTFANIRVDLSEYEKVIFDVSTVVTQAAESVKPFWTNEAETKGFTIDIHTETEDGCFILGQENEIFEAFVNLIRNAAEASPQGGTIKITAMKDAGEVVISVQDMGTGISEENLKRVFEPLWSTKGTAIGKGMGLAVCHGLVKRHGGSISVQSKLGIGTTFTIRLPLATEAVKELPNPSLNLADAHLTILVIDDELYVAELIQRICSRAGHKVFMALSGSEALRIFQEEKVDLVICDLGMPGMNGWEVGKAIKSICEEIGTIKPPFVLLTGWGGQELEKDKIEESGTDKVIAKPISPAELLQVVQEIAARQNAGNSSK